MKRIIQTEQERKQDVENFLRGAGFNNPYLWDSTGVLINDEFSDYKKELRAFEDFDSKIRVYPGSKAMLIWNGVKETFEEQLTFGDILKFAQKALIKNGDEHHIFLEGYTLSGQTWTDPVNVFHLTFGS
jgi:hypothetical protein